MWDIVWVSPQGHRSVSLSRHFLLQAPLCSCSAQKRFSRDHCCWGKSIPDCRIVGSHTRWELITWADFQLCLHRLLMSTGCKWSHRGFPDVSRSSGGLRISGWIGQLHLKQLTTPAARWRSCSVYNSCDLCEPNLTGGHTNISTYLYLKLGYLPSGASELRMLNDNWIIDYQNLVSFSFSFLHYRFSKCM